MSDAPQQQQQSAFWNAVDNINAVGDGVAGGILQGAGEFASDTIDGFAAIGNGVAHVVTHPLESASAVGHAIVHPVETTLKAADAVNAVADHIGESIKSGAAVLVNPDASIADKSRVVTRGVLEVGSLFVGVGEVNAAAKASTKAAAATRGVVREAAAAERAAQGVHVAIGQAQETAAALAAAEARLGPRAPSAAAHASELAAAAEAPLIRPLPGKTALTAEQRELQEILDGRVGMFREDAQVGNGSTQAAAAHTKKTGQLVGDSNHMQKLYEMETRLSSWLKDNALSTEMVRKAGGIEEIAYKASASDVAAARNLLEDVVRVTKMPMIAVPTALPRAAAAVGAGAVAATSTLGGNDINRRFAAERAAAAEDGRVLQAHRAMHGDASPPNGAAVAALSQYKAASAGALTQMAKSPLLDQSTKSALTDGDFAGAQRALQQKAQGGAALNEGERELLGAQSQAFVNPGTLGLNRGDAEALLNAQAQAHTALKRTQVSESGEALARAELRLAGAVSREMDARRGGPASAPPLTVDELAKKSGAADAQLVRQLALGSQEGETHERETELQRAREERAAAQRTVEVEAQQQQRAKLEQLEKQAREREQQRQQQERQQQQEQQEKQKEQEKLQQKQREREQAAAADKQAEAEEKELTKTVANLEAQNKQMDAEIKQIEDQKKQLDELVKKETDAAVADERQIKQLEATLQAQKQQEESKAEAARTEAEIARLRGQVQSRRQAAERYSARAKEAGRAKEHKSSLKANNTSMMGSAKSQLSTVKAERQRLQPKLA